MKVDRNTPRDEYGIKHQEYLWDELQKGNQPMQSTAIKQVQDPELYLAADVEQLAKGGWKRTIKCSVRVFDGDATAMFKLLEDSIGIGLAIADETLRVYDEKKETTNGPE